MRIFPPFLGPWAPVRWFWRPPPPVIPEHGFEDAISFFKHLVDDRRYVQQKLQGIHDRESQKVLRQHPPHVYQDVERLWYQNHKKNSNKNNLHRLWKGTGEILGRIGTNQYLMATEKGEMILDTMRIQPYMPSSLNEQTPLHYHTDQKFLVETDTYIVKHIRDHRKTGGGKNQRLEWEVKYRGHPDHEWQPASSFMKHVTDVWLKYNKKHNVEVSIKDLRILQKQDSCLCWVQADYESLYRDQRRQRKELERLEKMSRP